MAVFWFFLEVQSIFNSLTAIDSHVRQNLIVIILQLTRGCIKESIARNRVVSMQTKAQNWLWQLTVAAVSLERRGEENIVVYLQW